MGVSDSGLRCADEITEIKEIAEMTRANRNNLVFMNWDSLFSYDLGKREAGNYQKARSYSTGAVARPSGRAYYDSLRVMRGLSRCRSPAIQKRHQIILHHAARGFEFALTAAIE